MTQDRRHRECRYFVIIAVAVLALVAVVAVVGVPASLRTSGSGSCEAADAAPGGRWCRVYQEDFTTPASLGSFTNKPATDWHLTPDHPYARSLRSYPDGWGTTSDWSLNYASRTTDVVPRAKGAGGVLRVHGHTEEVNGRPQALAGSFYPVINPMAKDGRQQVAQTYGRYTVRFTTSGGYRPTSTGRYPDSTEEPRYGTAFLLWPANDRWADGEVDYPEMAWGAPVAGYVHTIGRPEVNSDDVVTSTSTEGRWNTAVVEWTPGLLVFSLNGVEIRRVTTNVPSTPFRWGFQSGGTFGTPAADLSGYLYVDAISIDAYAPTGGEAR